MRYIFSFIFLIGISLSLFSQKIINVKFKYAKVYLYNVDNKIFGKYFIIKNGKLDSTVTDSGVVLSEKHLKSLLEISKNDFCDMIPGLSKTHLPHHGIVFYDDNDIPVSHISIGFEGETLRIWPKIKCKENYDEFSEEKIKAIEDQFEIIKQIFIEVGYPVLKSPFLYKELYLKDK